MSEKHKPGLRGAVLSPGMRFGAYEILERLGAGGMGDVYRARDTRLGREVAIKTINLNSHADPSAIARFEREARSASSLNHPNIVTIYELGQIDATHYIAMELVKGETLRQMLAAGPIPFGKAITIAAHIADALAKAHDSGIVHRDLKPENLMLSADGTAKILDFGLAKLGARQERDDGSTAAGDCTLAGAMLGTIAYMSPEQASGGAVDFRSDQFSFASVLYEITTGRAAFRRNSQAETIASVLRDDPASITTYEAGIPAPFVWIVERCLAKDPARRYASTRDLANELASVRDGLPDPTAPVVPPRTYKLPVPRTALIGREREAVLLRALIAREDVRLVTLTGPGGIGKSRLALHVVADIAGQFPCGACFVALSAVAEASSVGATIANAVGVCEGEKDRAEDALREFMAQLSHPMLLLLDNFEHLVTAAPLVSALLSAGPRLKMIVTSQSPLHVYGEHEFPVPPLAVPNPEALPSLSLLARQPAVALFVERAQAANRAFTLTQENAASVAGICKRLDGLPLAIELAAARTKVLSPAAMQTRLESALNLLTGGARDLPTRQQTLRGTIDWSYNLLDTAEQTLFRRLGVFVGGCTLEGAEAVCDTSGDLGLDVLDAMASMVDKSLVQQVGHAGGEARFAMLSTIREYALERLVASGEADPVHRAHAAYCLVLAEEGAGALDDQSGWMDRFELEHDNFRVALDYLIRTRSVDWALRLGAALFRFWESREYLSEGRDRLSRLLALEAAMEHPRLRARLLFASAVLAGEQGDFSCAHALFEESLETCRALDDRRGVAVALNALAVNARDRGDFAAAASLFEQCVHIWKDSGDVSDTARAVSNLANVCKLRGDFARAFSLYEECLAMFRKVGDGAGMAWTLNYVGDVAREISDVHLARSYYEQSLASFRELRDAWGMASTLSDLAAIHYDHGDYGEAHRLYSESIRLFHDLGHKRGVARVLESLALALAAQGHALRALRLAGAAAALRQRLGAPALEAEKLRLERALDFARKGVSNGAGMRSWMEGWALPVEDAIEEAQRGDEFSVPTRNSA